MDVLVMGRHILRKQQHHQMTQQQSDQHLAQFQLD
jgi:hypothetical protein